MSWCVKPQRNLSLTFKRAIQQNEYVHLFNLERDRAFKKMIHKCSYLISPQTHSFSVAVCFPSASWNCSVVNTLGKMGSVILLVSISEMIFFLSQWGSQFAVRLSTQWYVRGSGGNYELLSRCRSTSSNCKRQYFKINWKPTLSVLPLHCVAMQRFFCLPLCSSRRQLSPLICFQCSGTSLNVEQQQQQNQRLWFLKGKGVFARLRALSHSV